MAKYIISISGGNDSVACLQYAITHNLNCVVVYCDTGWSSDGWEERLEKINSLHPYPFYRVKGKFTFAELCKYKQAFPRFGMQFCTQHLKGIPFLQWLDENDPNKEYTIILGKRRDESPKRKAIPEFIEFSEYHGDRRVWHPLYLFDDSQRNDLINQFGVEILPHRSTECFPCVNSGRAMLQVFAQDEEAVKKVENLEIEIGQPMFRAQTKQGAIGIREVIKWANSKHGKYKDKEDSCAFDMCGD